MSKDLVNAYVNGTCAQIGASEAELPTNGELPLIELSSVPEYTLPISENGFTVARAKENPGLLIIDFKDNAEMSDTVDRLGIFVMVNDRQNVPTDKEFHDFMTKSGSDCKKEFPDCGLGSASFWYADYVADFYNKCAEQKLSLNENEQELLAILESAGFITSSSDGRYIAPLQGGIVSLSRSYAPDARLNLLVHELSHACYFTDDEFREGARDIWRSLNCVQRTFIQSIISNVGVYGNNLDIYIEEAQAYSLGDQQLQYNEVSYFMGDWLNSLSSSLSKCTLDSLTYCYDSSEGSGTTPLSCYDFEESLSELGAEGILSLFERISDSSNLLILSKCDSMSEISARYLFGE